jgi:hypothetical protein
MQKTSRRDVLTVLGKIIWKEMCRYAGDRTVVHVIEHFSEDILPVGTKTLKRRLSEDSWTLAELRILQQTLQSDELKKFITENYL